MCFIIHCIRRVWRKYERSDCAFVRHEMSPSPPKDASSVKFVDGSVAFFLAHCGCPADAGAVLAPLNLRDAELVLFQVNNNADVERAGGGSHWSLLAYVRGDGFKHYGRVARF